MGRAVSPRIAARFGRAILELGGNNGMIVAPWQLLMIRVADRIGKGVRTSPRDALIADATDPSIRGRALPGARC